MAKIRWAKEADARGIHEAHMRSIREVCSKDHSPEEVAAWGGRAFNEERVLDAIRNHLVWVVDSGQGIAGYGHLKIYDESGIKRGHVHGLYLTPEVLGQGFGGQIADQMLVQARAAGAVRVTLESTLTAHAFYLRLGLKDKGPMTTVPIAGMPIRCIPMELSLRGN